MTHRDLHPFVSLLLAESPRRQGAALATELTAQIAAQQAGRPRVTNINRIPNIAQTEGLHTGWITYREEKPATWTSLPEFTDRLNHVVIICVQNHQVAFYASDPMVVRLLQRGLDVDHDVVVGDLERIAPARLNAAFVREKTVTLWLSGLHRRTDTKVDNKVITGSDLRYALDPLNDQTYAFSAARSRVTLVRHKSHTVGVAPVKSSVWLGPSPGWSTFVELVRQIFAAIPSAKKGITAPLPCLAFAVDSAKEFNAVGQAFDASLVSTEEFEPNPTPEEQAKLAVWRDVRVVVTATKTAEFTAKIHWPVNGGYIEVGLLEAKPVLTGSTLDQGLTWRPRAGLDRALRAAIDELFQEVHRRPGLLKVWYESGHVLNGRAIHQMQFREFEFDGYIWDDFTGYDVTKEKPYPLGTARIGRQDSLFCWVFNKWKPDGRHRWRGWLACTDGAMEMADFIHLNEEETELTLIHAKGADSGSAARHVSVSSYEIVSSQAVKNLRHLDVEIVAGRFNEAIDHRLQDACWHNGRLVAKNRMLTRLKQVGASVQRRVLILQPHACKSALNSATNDHRAKIRAAQLHTLLLGVQQNCRSLNARFGVITDES